MLNTSNTLALNNPQFLMVEASWNVMAHAHKPDFIFRWKGRVHLNRRGTLVQSTTGSRGVRISGSDAGYTMFQGSVKGTGYPLHSPVSPSFPLRCITVCYHISIGVYTLTKLHGSIVQQTILSVDCLRISLYLKIYLYGTATIMSECLSMGRILLHHYWWFHFFLWTSAVPVVMQFRCE